MPARLSLPSLCLALLVVAPASAQEKTKSVAPAETVACAGPFAPDSSLARLIETYGQTNVVTGQVDGPEGTTYLASTVFPDDPARRMIFTWYNEAELTDLASVDLAPSQFAPGGVRIGMTPAEVEAINGEPFNIGGFWWDYGGYAGFDSGALLGPLAGGCFLTLRFAPADEYSPAIDVTPVMGEVQVPSNEGLLDILDVRVTNTTLSYPLDQAME